MANRAILLGLDQDFFEDEEVKLHELAERNYAIPLLWLMLFQPGDVRMYHDIPLLLTSREAALANLARSAPGVTAFLGPASAGLVQQWCDYIGRNTFANYLLNTYDLKIMEDEEGQFRAELQQWLAEFAQLAGGTATTRELAVVTQASAALTAFPYTGGPLPLCGTSFTRSMPWERRAA